MDDARFADLLRALSRPASRRHTLGLLGGVLTAALGHVGSPAAAAPRTRHHHRCIRITPPFTFHPVRQCVNGVCVAM